MNLKQSRFISISLSPTLVKVAQISRSGVIEKIAKTTVSKGAVDFALNDALIGFQTKGAGILCVVPGDVATTKNLEVPSVDHEEIESILALQASRHTPFNKDEILTSYIKLGTPRPNFSRVLLVVVKRDAIKDKVAHLKLSKVKPDTLIFVPEAVSNFYAKALNLKKSDGAVAILDIGMQSSSFIVTLMGSTLMSRNIPVGIEHFAVDPEAGKQLIDEIKASLDAYEQEGLGAKPAKFYLTTNHMALAGIDAAIAGAFGVIVEIKPYTNFLNASKAIKDQISKDFADDSALEVVAAGVMAAKCQADLVPQEIKDQRSVSEKGREALVAGILVLVSLFFIGGALLSKVYFKDQFLKQNLISKYSEQRQEVQNLESMINKTRVLRQYLEARNVPLDAIRELYRIIPQEIYLSSVAMDDAGEVSVQGVSESMSKVFGFVTALEESSLFEGVKTKSTSAKKDRGKDAAAFEIVMKVSASSVAVASEVKKEEKK